MQLHPVLPILIVDDEPSTLEGISLHLRVSGFNNIKTSTRINDVAGYWRDHTCSLVLLDVIMPDANGVEILKQIKAESPDIQVIMVTGVNEVETAIECLKSGAFDYLVKPVEPKRLLACIANALNIVELEDDYRQLSTHMLSEELEYPEAFKHIHSENGLMKRLFNYVEAIGPTAYPVLITGETGVGKELFARAIHMTSLRNGPFVPVNVAGLDDTMFSDTLFGHTRGAFTGADTFRPGLVEQAANGTIFLDEIGDLSPQSQTKLLRLLQEKEYRRLGSDTVLPCNARIVTATCRSLEYLSNSTSFRNDLFYRLRTHHIHVPPLRERKDDLPVLTTFFADRAMEEMGRPPVQLPGNLLRLLQGYNFPGNVRELESLIINAVSISRPGEFDSKPIAAAIGSEMIPQDQHPQVTFHTELPTLKQIENLLIKEAVLRTSGNQTQAAAILGIKRQTLSYRLRQLS